MNMTYLVPEVIEYDDQIQTTFYHIQDAFLGERTLLTPTHRHEKWVMIGGEPHVQGYSRLHGEFAPRRHQTPELCFGKDLGGCFFSIANSLHEGEYFVYATTERPDVDLSEEPQMHFEISLEVRYSKPVEVTLAHRIYVTSEQVDKMGALLTAYACDWVAKEDVAAFAAGIIDPEGTFL